MMLRSNDSIFELMGRLQRLIGQPQTTLAHQISYEEDLLGRLVPRPIRPHYLNDVEWLLFLCKKVLTDGVDVEKSPELLNEPAKALSPVETVTALVETPAVEAEPSTVESVEVSPADSCEPTAETSAVEAETTAVETEEATKKSRGRRRTS